ncbi:MAG: MFS transporter [Armatimonadetes bacterium]|nr:MFS transporter [Armatimonadota bacterium]
MQAVRSTMITKRQGTAFVAAWLGWAFDGLDGFLYGLVALPFVAELLGKGPKDPETLSKAAIIQAVFLVGWALGGAVFGRIGDIIGRTKTLNLTILTYACFTGLAAISGAWWHLMIFRFVAALGIGGEWAAGSALATETLPKRYHHWGSAILQSGYMAGMIMASFTAKWMKDFDPRWVFVVGVIPAFVTLWIRKAIPEPDEWKGAKEREAAPPISALFSRQVLPTTLKVLTMSSITLCGAWTILYYGAQLIRAHPDNAHLTPAQLTDLVSNMTITYTLWNVGGNFAAAALTKYLGYRKGFTILLTGALIAFVLGFGVPRSSDESRVWITAAAFFGLGVFGAFPLYFPALFPTLLRTTGAGFCYNTGRIITAASTIFAAQFKDARLAFYYVGFAYVIVILLAFTMPEVREEPLAVGGEP